MDQIQFYKGLHPNSTPELWRANGPENGGHVRYPSTWARVGSHAKHFLPRGRAIAGHRRDDAEDCMALATSDAHSPAST